MQSTHHPSNVISALRLAAFCTALSGPAWAHHGRDFLITEDYALPSPGSGHFHAMFDWENRSDGDEFAAEPQVILGVLPQVALSLATRFDKTGSERWDYASVTPSLHVQLTSPESKCPFRVSLSAGYQFASGSGEAGHHEHEHEHEAGEEEGADHHEEEAGHEHSGIHNHEADQFIGRLILEQEFGSTKVIFNLISAIPDEGGANWGYAAGVSHKIMDGLALGLEATGDFESGGEHELVIGGYFEPSHSIAVKLGVGFGLTDASPDVSVRGGLVFRF